LAETCGKELEEIGVKVDASGLDYGKVFAFSRKAADTLSRGVGYLLKKNKIDLISGQGVITSAHEIEVKGHGKVTGKNLLIATGSRPRPIPGFEFDEKTVLSSTGALMLEKLPKRICILGGGAIGVEFAHIMNAFGVEVHLVEMLDQLLPLEDGEAVEVLVRSFKKRGVNIYTSTKATGYAKSGKALKVSLEGMQSMQGKQELEVDQILLVVGRVPNTDGIGLEKLGRRALLQGKDLMAENHPVRPIYSRRFTVPATAVVGEGDRSCVFVVREGLASRVEVRLGEASSGRVEVLAGVATGDRIVIAPPPGLTDGSAVEEEGQ